MFKLHFGRLIGKAYTTGERVLRFAAIAHNTAELRCGRMIEKFPEIVTRLAGVVERFATALDCVDTGFLADGVLDQLPPRSGSAPPTSARRPQQTPDANALRAALALAPAPNGFTVGNFAAKVHAKTGTSPSTPSGERRTTCANFATNSSSTSPADAPLPGSGAGRAHHRCAAHPPRPGHRVHPRRHPQPTDGPKPKAWTSIDRDYEQIRVDMQTLFDDLALTTPAPLAA